MKLAKEVIKENKGEIKINHIEFQLLIRKKKSGVCLEKSIGAEYRTKTLNSQVTLISDPAWRQVFSLHTVFIDPILTIQF